MKKYVKKVVKKIAPRITSEIAKIRSIDGKLDLIIDILSSSRHDSRLDGLRLLLSKVEPYQPTYGLTGLIDSPSRSSLDRCRAIEQYMNGQTKGKKVLDIGSSLGYMCFYFADRGARAEGWEMNADNAEASRAISELNGIPIDIKTKLFDQDTVDTIGVNDFDVVILLSVVHHIIHFNGLESAQKLIAELVRKTPVLIVELARKGEDKDLFWDKAQPRDEMSVFDLVKDEIDIKKIGDFGNHLSDKKRSLYAIERKKIITVNDKKYIYEKSSSEAYDFSESAIHNEKRRYYWTDRVLIKEYIFERGKTEDNARLIINEISYLLKTKDVPMMPKMIDYEISSTGAKIVYQLIKGEVISTKRSYSDDELEVIYHDILSALDGLHKMGIFHNDIRTWNVVYDGGHAFLIDLAQASGVDEDNDLIALMWTMSSLYKGVRESTDTAKSTLPKINDLPKFLESDYKKMKQGVSQANLLSGK